jgi:hypothetical protein
VRFKQVARAATAALAAMAALALVGAPGASSFAIGLDTYGSFESMNGGIWTARAATEGAQVVRLSMYWAAVAPPSPRTGFVQQDPGTRFYTWAHYDALVRSLAARGLPIMIEINGAPRWAEGPNPAPGAVAGTWMPNAAAFGRFAQAAAERYSGHFPDPLHPGRFLPRVRYWEAWNEPNLPEYLTPQWVKRGGRYVAYSPTLYRGLLNAFYTAVKKVSRSNLVLAGATAPFGDLVPAPEARIPPATFDQDLFCLTKALRSAHCGAAAHFDILDHHPFDIAGPTTHAINPGDVSTPDMGKLTRLLAAARRARTIAPAGRKQLWASELVWTSKPPDPGGVPLSTQAHYLEQSLYILWSAGVDTVLWLQIVDDAPSSTALDGGLYFTNGKPKPAATAFRFPFVTVRRNATTLMAWGHAPIAGRLRIQRRAGRRWVTVKTIRVRRFDTFFVRVPQRGVATLRAAIGSTASLPWP